MRLLRIVYNSMADETGDVCFIARWFPLVRVAVQVSSYVVLLLCFIIGVYHLNYETHGPGACYNVSEL